MWGSIDWVAIFLNLSLKMTNQKQPKSHAQYVIKSYQSQMSHIKIASKGKMPLKAK